MLRRSSRFCLASLALVLSGCTSNSIQISYLPASPADSLERFVSATYPDRVAMSVGLSRLALQRLPPGVRELRFELHCSACLPEQLIRLVEIAGNPPQVSGEMYEVSGPSALVEQKEGCGPWQPATGPREELAWCRYDARSRERWSTLLASLDSLGITGVPGDSGGPLFESVIEPDGTGRLMPRRNCGDITGLSLVVETAEGADYRWEDYGCLRSPEGESSEAAAAALELLQDFIGQAN